MNTTASCLSLLLKNDFLPILEQPESYSLSQTELSRFLLNTPIEPTHFTKIAATFLALGLQPLLFPLIAEPHKQPPSTTSMTSTHQVIILVHAYFNLDIYYFIAKYQPLLLPELLAFQKEIFFTQIFSTTVFSTHPLNFTQTTLIYKLIPDTDGRDNQELIELTLKYFLEFLLFSNPKNFDEDSQFFNTRYFHLLTSSMPLVTENLKEPYMKIILSSINTYSQYLYSSIVSIFPEISLSRFSNPDVAAHFFLSSFSQPELCSIAFKENNTYLLTFCNVEKCIQSNPELFS